ncbi:MAG: flagellar protein FlaG [Gammaproteobacteria bacterium]|nr:flagellar protein FlaG [Gammaproteobacteria bacterium]
MISEISQNAVGVISSQQKGGSGSVSRVQEQSAVETSNVTSTVKQEQAEPAPLTQPAEVDQKEIEEVVDDLNDFAQSVERQLEFSVDQDSGKTIIRVVDAETGETIRDIPPEEILNMQKQLRETSERLFSHEDPGVSLLFQAKA